MDPIQQASTILEQGGIVIFPTDTAFGIGCRIDNDQAIRRLFHIRRRPETKATPVLVDSIEMANSYFSLPVPTGVKDLMETYWPGGLTIVYSVGSEKIPSLVRGGTNTIGLRMPNHQDLLRVIHKVGVPILGPSANFHTYPTPYTYEDVDPELIKEVDYVLAGECGLKQVSTVVDCTGVPFTIIRQGAVTIPSQHLI